MILTELAVRYVGPFSSQVRIRFEDNVTVFTGANDSGKTAVLNSIELLCGMTGGDRLLQESDVNLDRIGHATSSWKRDQEITCEAIFRTTDKSRPHVANLEPNAELRVVCKLAPECRQISDIRFRQVRGEGGWSRGGSVKLNEMPKVIRLPLTETIRAVVDLAEPNAAEMELLKSAFGPQFSFEKYKGLSESSFYGSISKARGDLNAKLRRFLPPSMSLEFDLQSVNGERNRISIQLRDGHEGHTPLGLRGSGVRALVSLMSALLATDLDDKHYILLLDEPENSLHADAQHKLRSVLESLASKENLQIVYATHSPSMINPVLTSSLRLVSRDNSGQLATSVVCDRPIDENFLKVRSSLGITAADSLLYGPVTLVVEGPTEVIGLPIILGRFWQSKMGGFEDVGELLPQVHFLDGCGDSFDQLCKVAISQGTRPVVFLDGDKAGSRLNKLQKHFPEVPIVLLDGRSEFEEIVPRETYFKSLSMVMNEFSDEAPEKLTEVNFERWLEAQSLPVQMAFSKQIDRWVVETLGLSVEKPLVMKHVLTNVDLEDVKTSCLIELLQEIRTQLQ